jgi:large subunit ribosomal protein L1
VGKLSFSTEDLQANVEAFIDHIRKSKPQSAKGHFMKKVCLSATMSPSLILDVS